jgi:hypothetical protein
MTGNRQSKSQVDRPQLARLPPHMWRHKARRQMDGDVCFRRARRSDLAPDNFEGRWCGGARGTGVGRTGVAPLEPNRAIALAGIGLEHLTQAKILVRTWSISECRITEADRGRSSRVVLRQANLKHADLGPELLRDPTFGRRQCTSSSHRHSEPVITVCTRN